MRILIIVLMLIILYVGLVGCSSNKIDTNPHITIVKEIFKHQYNKRVKEVSYETKW
jgi:hypothetical protein